MEAERAKQQEAAAAQRKKEAAAALLKSVSTTDHFPFCNPIFALI